MCAGSIGNQHFEESETEAIGSQVVGVIPCSYVRYTPREGGYDIEQASCFDAQGWLPGFIQGLGVTAQQEKLRETVNYLKDGTIPTPHW